MGRQTKTGFIPVDIPATPKQNATEPAIPRGRLYRALSRSQDGNPEAALEDEVISATAIPSKWPTSSDEVHEVVEDVSNTGSNRGWNGEGDARGEKGPD